MGRLAEQHGPPKTVKDAVMDILREEGYDFMTAAEEFEKIKADLAASGKKEKTYTVGRASFTLRAK